MSLHGNQKKFDKNGDGRLNAGEWHRWYFATYGHDIEMSERRKQALAEDDWNSWLAQSAHTIRRAANSFVAAACTILPSTQDDAKELAWRALLCQITTALVEGDRWLIRNNISSSGIYVNGKVGFPFRVWAYDLAKLSGLCSQKTFEQAARSRQVLFASEGELTAERCGSFWQQVIAQLPPYDETSEPSFADGAVCSLSFAPDTDPAIERALEDLLQSLFPLAAFFAGEMDAADRRNNRFSDYFISHWRRLRGVYIPFCDAEVEQLLAEFPQLKDRWTPERLSQMECADLLDELYRAEPELALTIWRSLAETTEPITDPETAEQFFCRLETVLYDGEADPELLRPLLDALQEEAFARQMFQSAFVNFFHANLINAAPVCGKYQLAEHFRELLYDNPLPRKRWELCDEELEALFAPEGTAKPAGAVPAAYEAVLPDDGTVFHYCTVQLAGIPRPYVYLTEALPLKVGDWVEVPFGKDDIPRRGQVSSLTDCTRTAAPWPPEQTKTVLRVLEAPHKEA